MSEDIFSYIFVGGTTKKIYKHNKVIIVNGEKSYYHQRFVLAYELGYYLLEGKENEEYTDEQEFFCKSLKKDNSNSNMEILAERFAIELLMPENAFCRQYLKAMEISNHNIVYTIEYLSAFFKVDKNYIKKRIKKMIQ